MNTLTPAACAEHLRTARAAVALTGAGISTAAGIPDFRGPRGLYVTRRYDPETIFDIRCFRRDPRPFFDFTRDFLQSTQAVQPTFAHEFLARLESSGRLQAVITQNIDALHEMAGSRHVVPIHGNYWTSHCLQCARDYPFADLYPRLAREAVPHCSCGGVIKPDVVFFGEPVRGMDVAQSLVTRSDLLLVLGSSLAVHPAAWLPQWAPGAVIVVNRGEVALAPGPRRFFVDADLDEYFRAVDAHLTDSRDPA